MTYLSPLNRCIVCSQDGDPVSLFYRGENTCHKCIKRLLVAEPGYQVLIAVVVDPTYYQESGEETHGA